MPTKLKNNAQTNDPRLDRVYEEDWNSLNYLIRNVPVRALPVEMHKPRSYTYECNLWLDQGEEGACVSTGCGHELAAKPVPVSGLSFPWCVANIYYPAQMDDPWPGGEYPGAQPRYSGTSTLAGVKQLQRMGFVTGYDWALTLKDAVLGLGYHGPAICGFNWWTGMFDTNPEGFITPTGQIEGGHCLLAMAVKIVYKRWSWGGWWRRNWEDVDLDKSYITLHNSWGQSWGVNGRAKITLRHFGQLLDEHGGEVCFVNRNNAKRSVSDATVSA